MNVTQTNSLSKAYQLQQPQQVQVQGELGGQRVEQQQGAPQRAFNVKGKWDRFVSRFSHGVKHAWRNTDSAANTRAERFNKRHEKFSGKIANVVKRLAAGESSDVRSADVMATLRNDVKWMNKNASWAGRTDLLASRMDVELTALSGEELATVAESLKDAHNAPGLTDKDKADIRTMQRAVARQQLSRSPAFGEVLGQVRNDAPSDVSGKDTLVQKLGTLELRATELLGQFGIVTTDNKDVLSGAMSIGFKRQNFSPEEKKAFNLNLLNVERAFVKSNRRNEIATMQPNLRMLARVVRDEFLQTKVGSFKDENLRSRMKVLGSGAAHEVTKGSFEVGGEKVSMVHKYDDEQLIHPRGGRFGAPEQLRIDQSNPRLLERAVFTADLDKTLGFGVSVGTSFARYHDQTGIVMELAKGTTASNVGGWQGVPQGSNTAIAQKELMKLQLLDILTGQADRHRGNYMVEQNQRGEIIGIKAIDSDFSMGPEPDDASLIVGKHAVHLPDMPPVIDSDMAEKIRTLTDDDIRRLGDGMFDDDSINAAIGRLHALKTHIDKLEVLGNIIAPDQWGQEKATDLLNDTPGKGYIDSDNQQRTAKTSYYQRDYIRMGLMQDMTY